MSTGARMLGIVRSPRQTFEAVAVAPRWADVLAVTFLATAFASALLLETEVGRLALLDQWERTAIVFGQPVDDTRYAAIKQASEYGAAYALASSFLSGPLLAVGVSAVLSASFRGATYRQVLAIVAHASVILMLRQLIAAPLVYARETLASPMTLSLFFTMLDEASPLARFLGIIDLFVVWWVIVLAIGVSVLSRRPARVLALMFVGIYVVLAMILAAVMALTGGIA